MHILSNTQRQHHERRTMEEELFIERYFERCELEKMTSIQWLMHFAFWVIEQEILMAMPVCGHVIVVIFVLSDVQK